MTAVGTAANFSEAEYRSLTRSKSDEGQGALRERFEAEGYLYFPRALNASRVTPVLEDMLSVLEPHIRWCSAEEAPVLAGEPFFESDPLWDALYPKVQALESLHRIFHCREVRQLMSLVSGPDIFVYPMKMARIAAPRKLGFETPPHQDAYSHHAGPTMAGIWVALHDADESMGRLTILPGSHLQGVRPVVKAQGVGGVQCTIDPEETLWHVSDVTAGDVIIFHSQTVHRAQANVARDRVRLSIDTRFCDYGAPVFSTNLEPHHGWRIPDLDWEYVYRHWKSRDLCYYWRDYPALF